MNSQQDLLHTQQLLQKERMADMEYYRQKVLLRSLSQRTHEGTTWYPVRIIRDYIGTGERLMVELERTSHHHQPHAFQSGKVVSFFSNQAGKPNRDHVTGVVNYVREDQMVITLNSEELPDWIGDYLLGVDVMFDEVSYREMDATLKAVMKAEESRLAELREILLGYKKPQFVTEGTTKPHDSSSLNPSQAEALHKITTAADVAIIHGPPGTGKTTTLVEAIKHTVASEHQVLACAPSNAAIDLLVEKLSDAGLQVLRIGHPARVTEQSLSKTLDARIAMHDHYKELKGMRKRIEQLRDMAFKYKRNFGYQEREQRKLLLQESKALKADADVLEFYIISDLLKNAQVITCTLVGAAHGVLHGKKFKTVFIDEAGQALEPACWIPILKSQRVIFAGDHQQLPPTIKSIDAAQEGLAKTLFEKVIEHHPQCSSMLQVQYRMNEHIMKFSSEKFYDGKLIAHESVIQATLNREAVVEFIDTAGMAFDEKQDPETLSRLNKEEAALLIHQLELLVERVGVDEWLSKNYTLGIITPYRAQVDYLITLAEKSDILGMISHLTSINTVDAFQGQERDVIAISFVRSNEKSEVGFLADIRRTNVAMTRAKKKLLMIGDSATLGAHPFYQALIEHLQLNQFYKSGWELN